MECSRHRTTALGKSLRRKFCALLAAVVLSPALAQDAFVEPVAPDLASSDLLRAGVDGSQLQPGEFYWLPSAQDGNDAALTIIVDLAAQRAYVYRDGQPIAVSTVSTGRPGRETPTGAFEILAKERMHHSNLYDDAPMPFMQRLTWTGLSLHAGRLPGYPASHGCIRLPAEFAEQLFEMTRRGEFVVISDNGSAEALARAGLDSSLRLLSVSTSTVTDVLGGMGPAPAVESMGVQTSPDAADDQSQALFSHLH